MPICLDIKQDFQIHPRGGFESLALYQDKLALGNRSYTKLSNNEHIIRLHIGLEDPNDLIADIKQAIKSVR